MKINDVYLSGYYGMQNSGDDALMCASLWGIKKYLNAQSVRIACQSELRLPSGEVVKPTIARKKLFFGQHRLQHYISGLLSRRVVFGGGSVLSNAHDINLKLDVIRLAGYHNAVALGVGIGPFVDVRAEHACARFLNTCEFVGVRDSESYAIAKAIAPAANVKLTFDLAPSLLCHEGFRLTELPRRGIAFNICPVKDFSGNSAMDNHRINELIKTINHLYLLTGEPIVLLDLNGHTQFGDTRLHEKLVEKLNGKVKVHIEPYDANPYRVIQKIAGYKAIAAMRLHGNVFGFMTNTPSISLSYHPKCAGWCEQIQLDASCQININESFAEPLTAALLQALETGETLTQVTPLSAIFHSLTNWSFDHEKCLSTLFSRYSTI